MSKAKELDKFRREFTCTFLGRNPSSLTEHEFIKLTNITMGAINIASDLLRYSNLPSEIEQIKEAIANNIAKAGFEPDGEDCVAGEEVDDRDILEFNEILNMLDRSIITPQEARLYIKAIRSF